MKEYIKGAEMIAKKGFMQKSARSGMPSTKSYSNLQLRFALNNGEVPILTTKQVSFKNVIVELLWFLRGEQNIKYLVDNNCHIWNDNAYNWFVKINKEENLQFDIDNQAQFVDIIRFNTAEELGQMGRTRPNGKEYILGDNGRIYGWQWRNRKVDQLQRMLNTLKGNPYSRQNKVVAWIPEDMDYEYVSQPNCHGDFTISGREIPFTKRLDLLKSKLHKDSISFNAESIREDMKKHSIPSTSFGVALQQRSGDYALGIPYNITSYSMLAYITGIVSNTVPTFLTLTCTDAHVYSPHLKTLGNQCKRTPGNLPTFTIKGKTFQELLLEDKYKGDLNAFLNDVTVDDFKLVDYQHQGKVEFKLFTGKATNKKQTRKSK